MRRRIGQALRIGVSATAVSLLRSSRWRGAALTLLAERPVAPHGDPHAAIGRALLALLRDAEMVGTNGADAGVDPDRVMDGGRDRDGGRDKDGDRDAAAGPYAGWPATIVLADDLARLWHVPPPREAARLADLAAAAALRFQSLYGESLSTWRMAAHWDARQPFVAAAVPQTLLAALQASAEVHRLAVVEIAPQFIHGWNRWRSALTPGAWFGLLHGQTLTLGALDDRGRLAAVRVVPVPPDGDAAWLAQALAREALLLDRPVPSALQLCGAASSDLIGAGAVDGIALQSLDKVTGAARTGWSPASLLAACGSRT